MRAGTLVKLQANSKWPVVISRDGDAQLTVQLQVGPEEGQATAEVEVRRTDVRPLRIWLLSLTPPEFSRKSICLDCWFNELCPKWVTISLDNT